MTWNELRKIAEKSGWSLNKHGKKHDRYVKAGHPPLLIERHWNKEVKIGLLMTLLKQINK